jgi:hypothetical protein
VRIAAFLVAVAVLGGTTDQHADASSRGHSAVLITLADSPDPVAKGAPVTYTATITNTQPVESASVTLYFGMSSLPADPLTHLPAKPAFRSGSTSVHTCRKLDATFICPLGRLPARAVVTARFVVVPKIATLYRAQFAGSAYTHVQGEAYSANSEAVQQTLVRS